MSAAAPIRRLLDSRSLRWVALSAAALAAAGTRVAIAAEIPLDERRSGYDADEPRDQGDAGRRHRQSRHALGARRRGAVERARRAQTASACADCHGDAPQIACTASRRAIRRSTPSAAARSTSSSASTSAAPSSSRRRRSPTRAATCWRSPPMSRVSRAGCRSRARRCAASALHRGRPQTVRAPPGPAQSLLRALPRRQLGPEARRQSRSRRRIRPAIRSTGSNGRALGSLQRRLRNCLIGMRAEPYAYGAPEYVDLELFLMWRARGMTVETPAVRP